MRNAVYISTYRTVRTTHVLRINSRLRMHAAATRLIYLRAPDDAAAITSTSAIKNGKKEEREENTRSCSASISVRTKASFRVRQTLILLESANT